MENKSAFVITVSYIYQFIGRCHTLHTLSELCMYKSKRKCAEHTFKKLLHGALFRIGLFAFWAFIVYIGTGWINDL